MTLPLDCLSHDLNRQFWYLLCATYWPPFWRQKQVGSKLNIAPKMVGSVIDSLIHLRRHPWRLPWPTALYLVYTPRCQWLQSEKKRLNFVYINDGIPRYKILNRNTQCATGTGQRDESLGYKFYPLDSGDKSP